MYIQRYISALLFIYAESMTLFIFNQLQKRGRLLTDLKKGGGFLIWPYICFFMFVRVFMFVRSYPLRRLWPDFDDFFLLERVLPKWSHENFSEIGPAVFEKSIKIKKKSLFTLLKLGSFFAKNNVHLLWRYNALHTNVHMYVGVRLYFYSYFVYLYCFIFGV